MRDRGSKVTAELGTFVLKQQLRGKREDREPHHTMKDFFFF
jgi:hypothetical protein